MTDLSSKREAARLRLRRRYLNERAKHGPRVGSKADKLPVGQVQTQKWPVLDLGVHPEISLTKWRLRVDGAVARPTTFSWEQFMELDQVSDVSDFHCVTTWSRFDLSWVGVPFWRLVEAVEPKASAQHILCHGYDDYTTNLSLENALEPDVLLVHTVDGAPLTREHGGPCRMITPKLYAWKGTKWIKRIEFLEVERLGYWELRGYSNSADPWTDDRYADDPADERPS